MIPAGILRVFDRADGRRLQGARGGDRAIVVTSVTFQRLTSYFPCFPCANFFFKPLFAEVYRGQCLLTIANRESTLRGQRLHTVVSRC